MKVLLINPEWSFMASDKVPWPPIGLMTVAGSAEWAGFEVDVLDINGLGLSKADAKREIERRQFDAAGVYCQIDTFPYVKWLGEIIGPDVPKVAGGAFATVCPEAYLELAGFDYVVIGEGEVTFPTLLQAIESGFPKTIKGIAYRDAGKIVRTLSRPRIERLDEFYHPAYRLFPMESYVRLSIIRLKGIKYFPILTARGCPSNCTFCNSDYLGGGVRLRGIEEVVHELEGLKLRYGLEGVYFADATFTAPRQRTIELCDALRRLGLFWYTETRVDCLDEELLWHMKKGGCEELIVGLESASQQLLDSGEKGITVGQTRKAIEDIRKAGITPFVFVLYGLPGETKDTIQATQALVQELSVHATPNLLFPIPGTPIFQQAEREGKLPPLPQLLERYSLHNTNNREGVVANLSEVSDERLARAVRETWERNEQI